MSKDETCQRHSSPMLYISGLCLLLLMVVGVGCASAPKNKLVSPPQPTQQRYVIQVGDELSIKFFFNKELNENVLVRPDGRISLQLVDEVDAAGVAPSELDKKLTELYSKELKDPAISVIVRGFGNRQLYVGGEVNRPSLVQIVPNMTPIQAVVAAGGLKDTANLSEVLLIRKGPDNRPLSYDIDLRETMRGNGDAGGVFLQPEDVVYVPKTGIAVANLFVDQYIRNLLLFNGFNVNYEVQSLSFEP
ncbi:MAG: polysaccharide export protein [Gammaproteobacteria bacterium]|nr:polysaccharide export protein [Gammaproteobacteria bacterium]